MRKSKEVDLTYIDLYYRYVANLQRAGMAFTVDRVLIAPFDTVIPFISANISFRGSRRMHSVLEIFIFEPA